MLALSSILLLVVGVLGVTAEQEEKRQDQSVQTYPDWVTNDYNCVIGCLQIFNETVTERPSHGLEGQAYECIAATCDRAVMGMNIYQAQYIIQMFYATGSIYEDPNMGQWGQGAPPPAPAASSNSAPHVSSGPAYAGANGNPLPDTSAVGGIGVVATPQTSSVSASGAASPSSSGSFVDSESGANALAVSSPLSIAMAIFPIALASDLMRLVACA